MSVLNPTETASPVHAVHGISARQERGYVVLSSPTVRPGRRILYINSYGGSATWNKFKEGNTPSHHLWGCIELARRGYEVALAEPIPHFNYRRPFPHDWGFFRWARSWLRQDDILYCGHTLLFWTPLIKMLGGLRCHLVSLTYARESLDFARQHRAIIALTPAAAEHARLMAPAAKVAHLGWGSDLTAFPQIPYQPESFLSCGITHRDHRTLCGAAALSTARLRIISPNLPKDLSWPPHATLLTGGRHDDTVSYRELLTDHYRRCTASLIILKNDPEQKTAVGFTNLIEAMSMARPVIVTRTGALQTEIDVEKAGCGLHVNPGDPAMLAAALDSLAKDPDRAAQMGRMGRKLAETHYNMERYSAQLHQLFESL